MPLYKPTMYAEVEAPVFGSRDDVFTFPIRVRSATIVSNDHNHADELEIEAAWSDAGIDPRFIRDANVKLYLGDAASGETMPLRFVGIARSVERSSSDGGSSVSIRAQDFTALFLDAKPYPSDAAPRFSDSLVDAWRKVCDSTGVRSLQTGKIVSTVERLREQIEFRGGVDRGQKIGYGLPPRIAKLGRVVPKSGADAWAVWQQTVSNLGLVTWMEFDKVVVSTSVDAYADNPDGVPVVVWGKNILEIKESSLAGYAAKGVGVMSFDAQTGRTIEAVYPDPSDPRVRRARATAARKSGMSASTAKSDNYEWFEYHGSISPERLQDIARRTWEERSRQEIEGSFSTAEMRVETSDRREFDMLKLRSGDSVRIDIDSSIDRGVFAALSEDYRVGYLMERGYAEGVAKLLAKNAKELLRLGTTYKAKEVRTKLETSEDGGTFAIDVSFYNRIVIEDALPS